MWKVIVDDGDIGPELLDSRELANSVGARVDNDVRPGGGAQARDTIPN